MAFTGKYNIVSIYTDGYEALDLNCDGEASINLLKEYSSIATVPSSSFGFLAAEDGGYNGQFSFLCPLQGVSFGVASPPYNLKMPVDYSGSGLRAYSVHIEMKLSECGDVEWFPSLQQKQESSFTDLAQLLYDASVRQVGEGLIDIRISEVPVYDFQRKELKIMALTYSLVHE